ncbi:MAG: phosphoribosylformylglycinamidine cyclo-ligase [Ignavibacteriales bacterium]|nr:phosphoribosylformylglycinamidine cyclo-ligase [Ignavibacteriales bacterium]HOJ18310.1 phosphoribosylformylglycinamidine cyclo-ligase [Ignavibacteriaceae bacterium]HPO55557.1 phosphoribosylformylglycinamidine cyclo-ligase [Ignavibacteriaceae bacterium]
MSETYRSAGVNLKAGDETVRRIKGIAKATFNRNVVSDIGLFGGLYELDLNSYKKPVLVSSVDGVGTKLKIAFLSNKHETIGQDLVNHCVNDIAVCGAKPLFFLDYLAVGKLVPDVAEKIIQGFGKACKENDCALIGGETAEMPGIYQENEYDVSGTIVGIVEKSKIINGKDIQEGDVLLGFPSTGLHTNGYSLARKVLLSKFSVDDKIEDLGSTLGDSLLKIHKSYLGIISELKNNFRINGFSHITGGGIIGNTMRIIPKGLKLKIYWNAWNIPPIFQLIQNTGNIVDEEMRAAFNMGIGLIAVVNKAEASKIFSYLDSKNENYFQMGEVIKD